MVTKAHIGKLSGHNVGIHNDSPLIYRLNDPANPVAKIHHGVFVNSSNDRYYSGNLKRGPFPANVPAADVLYDRKIIQIEGAAENQLTYSRNQDNGVWGKSRLNASTPVVTNDIVAPDGTLTGNRIVEDDTASNTHLLLRSGSVDGSSTYVYSIYAKAKERSWIYVAFLGTGFGTTIIANFDIGNGAVGSVSGGPTGAIIEDAKDGWYRCCLSRPSTDVGSPGIWTYLSTGNNGQVYSGDNASGLYLWNGQFELGEYPSSPIITEGTAITRALSSLRWLSADVPPAMRKRITFDWYPAYDNDVSDDKTICRFDDSGASHRITATYLSSSDKIRVTDVTGAYTAVESNALTFSRNQKMTVTIDPDAGSISVSGATSGDGTVIDTSWETSEGDIWWGSDTAGTASSDSRISEPYS
jgi:hypothetical protein